MGHESVKSGKCTFLEGKVDSVEDFEEVSESDVSGEFTDSGTDWNYHHEGRYTESSLSIPYRKLGLGWFVNKELKKRLYGQINQLVDSLFQESVPQTKQQIGEVLILGSKYDLKILHVAQKKVTKRIKIGESWASGISQGDFGAPGTYHDGRSVPIYGNIGGTLYKFRLAFREQ